MGFPKTDRLLNGSLDRKQILGEHGLAGDRPVILYAPTGQKHNSLETMGEEVIARLAQTGKYALIVKPHDHPKNLIDWRSRLAPLEGEHVRISRKPDVIRLLFVADLLITDASSVSSEYSLLDRPMVFLDVPKLLRRAAKAADAMVDTETWGRRCGRIVRQPDEIERIVAESLDDPAIGSDVRRAMAQDLFYNPGTATDAAMEWLTERLLKPDQTINASSGTAATPAGENREAAIEEAFGGKNE
jgi:CDP-glycerol glycerophosphotransferase (TagB/SpsB family)